MPARLNFVTQSTLFIKNRLNSTISMSYPDVVIACIEHQVSLEAFRAIEAALVKHDKNSKDYSLVVD